MDHRITSIYGLVHPVTGELRYIGKSVQPEVRLRQHIQETRRGAHGKIWSKQWIKTLLDQNLEPEMIILEEGLGDFWREAEAFWIAYFTSIGCKLLNLAPGGVGLGVMSPELKKARSRAATIGNLSRSHDEKKLEWVAVSPDGLQYEFLGLVEFCRQYKLEHSCMLRVAQGERKQYKGWLCWRKDTGPIEFKGVSRSNLSYAQRNKKPLGRGRWWQLTSPQGEVVKVQSLDAFCKQNGLHASPFIQAIKKGRCYRGWSGQAIDPPSKRTIGRKSE